MTSEKESGSKGARAMAADAAAAASMGRPPPPLPLPPGVTFASLRDRLKSSKAVTVASKDEELKDARGSVSSRVQDLNQKIRFQAGGQKPKLNLSAPPPDEAQSKAESKDELAEGDDARATHNLDSGSGIAASQNEDPAVSSGNRKESPRPTTEDPPATPADVCHGSSADVTIQGPRASAEVTGDEQLDLLDQSAKDQDGQSEHASEEPPSLLQLCQMSPASEADPEESPSEDALVDKIQQLLPDMDAFTSECDELFAACTAASGNATLSSSEMYDLTQRLIDLFGSRDRDVLERISLIYSSVEQTCGPDTGIGVVELRGYVASVLTQILHELESRREEGSLQYVSAPSRESTFSMLPPSSLEPSSFQDPSNLSAAEPGNTLSQGFSDVLTWLPGRQQSNDSSGSPLDLVRHSWASIRGSVASLAGYDVYKDDPVAKEAAAAVSEDPSAVQDCVARATVETAQDIDVAPENPGADLHAGLGSQPEGRVPPAKSLPIAHV